ncbi:MAG: hypothetical protein E6Q66_01610 [Pedobacter sp.]|nr:MAG: hypothetical protein E6Q66_01610 [Pedobacter sp.]
MLQYSHHTHLFYKMLLHISNNNRTFEAQNETEQSNSNFINPNKPRRSGASPATSDYPARSAATWALFTIFNLMQNEKKTPKTKKITLPIIKTELEDAKPDQNLHFSNNNRTFETLTELEQSNSIFLNPNKTQANRCKSCTSRFSGSVSSDLGFYLQQQSHMLTEKKTSREIYNPQIIKTEIEPSGLIAVHARNGLVKIKVTCSDPADVEKIIASLLNPYQQQ